MKKSIAIILALVMLLALCACGDTGNSSNTPAPASTPAPADNNAPADNSPPSDNKPEISWPNDTVTVYVPADVGAPLDLATRVLVDWLTEKTGGTFVVENDAAGGGARVANLTTQGEKDGTVLMSCGCGQLISSYNGTWDISLANPEQFSIIAPNIGQALPSGGVFVTQPDAPYNSIPELVEYVEANPNTVTVAVVMGTPHEVRLKLITEHYGISDKVRWVSCTNNDALTGLLGGTINLGCLTETVGPQYVADGSLKGLLNSRTERGYADDELKETLDSIPIVPDIIGGDCESLVIAWPMLVVGPGGMDDELCKYINDCIADIINSEEYMERVYGLGGTNTYQPMTVEEIRQVVADADAQLAEIWANFEG